MANSLGHNANPENSDLTSQQQFFVFSPAAIAANLSLWLTCNIWARCDLPPPVFPGQPRPLHFLCLSSLCPHLSLSPCCPSRVSVPSHTQTPRGTTTPGSAPCGQARLAVSTFPVVLPCKLGLSAYMVESRLFSLKYIQMELGRATTG